FGALLGLVLTLHLQAALTLLLALILAWFGVCFVGWGQLWGLILCLLWGWLWGGLWGGFWGRFVLSDPSLCPPPPALQLPLVSDGGGRAAAPEVPQHAPPARPRHMLGLPQPPFLVPRSVESIEIDQKLQEIMKQTGYLTVGGQQMRRSGNREENKRILMDLDVVLKSHDCPYIVQCFGTFITNTDVFIAMELMGTCAEKLKKRIQGPIPERILGKMTVAIVKALFYLKEKHGVIHRDVKPSNILLDERGQVKLCDFGISGRLVDSKAKTRSAGCAAYMAVSPYNPLYDPHIPFSPNPPHFSPPFQEHNFIKRYETLEVDVASWFKDVMARTESPRSAGGLSQHHLPFFTR
ncbi:dual specificity mitogen-activated protein kinase kinase 7-like, partial [Coturnix japonica]|uniref:dual specificity mitogen-activated protein kinase kinase 7-like n=1 Tax=Coturnix japonica TaxID=93934 RepID=UPI0013A5C0DD